MKPVTQQLIYSLLEQNPSRAGHVPPAMATAAGLKIQPCDAQKFMQEASKFSLPENTSSALSQDIGKGFTSHAPAACHDALQILEAASSPSAHESFDFKRDMP